MPCERKHGDRPEKSRRPAWRSSTASRFAPPKVASGEDTIYNKKIPGRKRHLAVDTLGLILAVVVHAADWQDQHGACGVLGKAEGEVSSSESDFRRCGLRSGKPAGLCERHLRLDSTNDFTTSRAEGFRSYCQNAGLSNAPSPGSLATAATAKITREPPHPAKRSPTSP